MALDLLGLEMLGDRHVYRELGQALLNRQRTDGSWRFWAATDNRDLHTACALLCLARSARGLIPYPSVEGRRATKGE